MLVLIGLHLNHTVAQPEIRYPNPAYIHWEQPCPDSVAYSHLHSARMHYPHIIDNAFIVFTQPSGYFYENGCGVNPFGTIEGKQTVYGVAFGLTPETNEQSPYVLMDRDISLDICLYRFMPGDSNVQLVKIQTFVVERNQRPDLFMLYRNYDAYMGAEDTLKFPMYEFYFDSPQDLDGYYYVGLHSLDSFRVIRGELMWRLPEDCCHAGYLGYVDMERNQLLAYLLGEGLYCGGIVGLWDSNGLWDPNYYNNAVLAPVPDSVHAHIGQFAFPITAPRGYLTATEPAGERESFRLLPNPARESVRVESVIRMTRVEVYDVQGRMVLRREVDGYNTTLDVSRWAKGSYAVRVHTERGVATKQLVVE